MKQLLGFLALLVLSTILTADPCPAQLSGAQAKGLTPYTDANPQGHSGQLLSQGRAQSAAGNTKYKFEPSHVLYGETAGDRFGTSMAVTEIFTGDTSNEWSIYHSWSVDRVVVGAPSNDGGGSNAGRVYIYSGTTNDTPDFVLTGEASGDRLGETVASAGDVNGDGWNDIIVGAPGNDSRGTNSGRAYIYFAGPITDAIADVVLDGEAAGDQFGSRVAAVGDVNADGFEDVGVSAPFSDRAGTNAGRVYVFYGGSSMNNAADVILDGESAGDEFGMVATLSDEFSGDLNGDGFSDVVVGSSLNDGGGTDAGRVYVFHGGSVMNFQADAVYTGMASGDCFGYAVSWVYGGFAVGAPGNDSGGQDAGAVYQYGGGSPLTGEAPGDRFGASVCGGYARGGWWVSRPPPMVVWEEQPAISSWLIVGADARNVPSAEAGAAYIFIDGADSNATFVVEGFNSGDHLGVCANPVAGGVGEVGWFDLFVAANDADHFGENVGALLLYQVFNAERLPDQGIPVAWKSGWAPYDICYHGEGGMIAAWADASGVYTQKLDKTMSLRWGERGLRLRPSIVPVKELAVQYDGISSFYVVWADSQPGTWSVVGQRILKDGTLAWGDVGRIIADALGNVTNLRMCVDRQGRAVVAWSDNRSGTFDVWAQCVDKEGTRVWGTDKLVSSAGGDQRVIGLTSGMSGGAIVGWLDVSGGYLQKLGHDGNPLWPTGGVSMGTTYAMHIASDGLGGTYGLWAEYGQDNPLRGQILLNRIRHDGLSAWNGGPAHVGSFVYPEIDKIVGLVGDSEGNCIVPLIRQWGGSGSSKPPWMTVDRFDPDGSAIGLYSSLSGDVFEGGDRELDCAVAVLSGRGVALAVAQATARGSTSLRYWSGAMPRISVRHVSESGVRGPFNPVGLDSYPHFLQTGPRIVSDGETGAFVAWSDICLDRPAIFAQWVDLGAPPSALQEARFRVDNAHLQGLDLRFGFSSLATDNRDSALGETELPPVPPVGEFDARLLLPTSPTSSSLRDYRSDVSTGTTWKVRVQGGSSGYPVTFVWDDLSNIPGNFTLKDEFVGTIVNVDMKATNFLVLTNPGITALKIEYTQPKSLTVQFPQGWNLVSAPLQAPDMSVRSLFPTSIGSAYAYSGGYQAASTFQVGKGYWLKMPAATANSFSGLPISMRDITLAAGWQIVGPFDFDVSVTEITSMPSGIVATPFYGYEGGYRTSTTLQSGKGYWIKASQAGTLHLSGSAMKPIVPEEPAREDAIAVAVVDAAGNKVELFLTEDSKAVAAPELPPVPPSGIFDARFSNNSLYEMLGGKPIELKLNSACLPLSITATGLNGRRLRLHDGMKGEVLDIHLAEGQTAVITSALSEVVMRLHGVAEDVPMEYDLFQNYPNPFNPTTIIRFALPAKSQVKIDIYDVQGSRVATLADREYPAGYHAVEVDASRLATGVYMYAIETDAFRAVKKMLVVR